MKLKNATLLGMIGAVISTILQIVNILTFDLKIIGYETYDSIRWLLQSLWLCSSLTLAIFFYTLYKNQK